MYHIYEDNIYINFLFVIFIFLISITLSQRCANVVPTIEHNMTTLAQRWRNVDLATVSLRWPNGPNYVAPTSPTYVGPTVLLTLGQRSCAIWAVPTSTIYTIRRSTCLFNDPPISIESNRIASYLFLY